MNAPIRLSQRAGQAGLTLIELMIAITIGLLILAAVVLVFQSNSQNYRQNEAIASLQDNARFALDVLARDLAMAGYWGGIRPLETEQLLRIASSVRGEISETANPGDCGPTGPRSAAPAQPWLFATGRAVEFHDHRAGAPTPSFHCLGDGAAGSDVVMIRRVSGHPAVELTAGATVALEEGRYYLKTNKNSGSIYRFNAASTASISSPTDCPDPESGIAGICPPDELPLQFYAYVPRIYYIRNFSYTAGDGVPALCRRELRAVGGVAGMQEEMLAPGVENLQVEWGIDTNNDQLVDRYTSAPDPDQLKFDTYTARISILVRAPGNNTAFSADNKTFQLGNSLPFTPTPRALRRSFTTTIQLKNLRS